MINCPVSHQLNEARWFKNQKWSEDYIRFWLGGSGNAVHYSCWLLDSVRKWVEVTGNQSLISELLPGMDVSISGRGKRPTLNSYMVGDAFALSGFYELNLLHGDIY